MTQAIVRADAPQMTVTADPRRALEPRSVDEAIKVAKIVAASGLFGVRSAEEAYVRIMAGVSLGLTAVQSLRGIHVIEGRPSPAADLLVAVCLASGLCEYFRCVETTAERAVYVTKRRGDPETRLPFTMAEAARISRKGRPLVEGDNWKNFPAQMLRARCSAALARMVFPDICHGLYTPEELGDDGRPAEVAVELVPAPQLAQASAPPEARPSPAPGQLPEEAKVDAVLSQVDQIRAVCKRFPGGETTFKRLARALKTGQVEFAEAMRQANESAALDEYGTMVRRTEVAEDLDTILGDSQTDQRLSDWGKGEVRAWCERARGELSREPGDEG